MAMPETAMHMPETAMHMPETAMHKDQRLAALKYYIRLAGQAFFIEAIAQAALLYSPDRIINSGLVSLPLIPDIIRLRVCA